MPTSRQRIKSYPINVINYCGQIFETPSTAMMKEFKISELFEDVHIKHKENIYACNEGPYPLIGQTSFNNGVVKYIDHYEFNINYNLLSLSHDNGGYGFVQTGKFSMTEKMHLLKLTKQYSYLENYLGIIAFMMTEKFTKIYSYSTLLNKERLMKETITLPVIVRRIDDKTLKMLANGETTLKEITNNGKNKDYAYEINENLLTNFVYTMIM